MSSVKKALSSVCVKMSCVNVKSRKKILPSVSQILYQVETIVASSSQPLDTATDLWWDECGVHLEEGYNQEDSYLSDVFPLSDAMSTSPTSPSRDSPTSSFSTESSRSSSSSSSRLSDVVSSTSSSETEQVIRELEDEIFLESVLQVLDIVAPNNVFNRRKSERTRRKRLKATVDPHLFPMWQSADDIASPTERVAKRYTVAKPVLEVVTPAPYPKVDWSCVNSRFIKNIPSPGKFLIHGCSQDRDLYKLEPDYCGESSFFTREANPFGSAYGYQTREGIVCVPEQAHYGYVWQDHQWVLHAKFSTQPRHDHKRRREVQRGKRGGRRGEKGERAARL